MRWWPAAVVAVAAAVALGWVWLPDRDGQTRVMLTLPVVFATVLLLALWLIFLSRLSRRIRTSAAVLVVMVLGAVAATTRIRGVTGDMVPIVEWRWSDRTPPARAALPLPQPLRASNPRTGMPVVPAPAAAPAVSSGNPAVAEPPEDPPSPADYPQFLGPSRDGTVTGVRLSDDWAARPPRLIWRRPIGAGWSGFAVARGIAVTQEQRGDREMVVAYNLKDGTPKWSHGDAAHYQNTIAGEGPRATPTIAGDRVYTLGSTGLLNCLDLETGRWIWRRDIGADNNAPQPEWGRSSSPLVVDDLVIVSAGGPSGRSLVAYQWSSGAPVWQAGDDRASYSSPVLATLAGVRQVVVLNQSTVVGHDPKSGQVLWSHDWSRSAPSVAVPLILPDSRVLVSAGYGMGSRLLQISRDGGDMRERLVWESPRLKAKFANPVLHDGFVYGLDDGVMVCLDPENGERRWKGGRYGHGQTLRAGNRLVVLTEEGELVLVDASPAAHREIGRFQVFEHKTWNPPALAGRYLVVRTDSEAAMYEMGVD